VTGSLGMPKAPVGIREVCRLKDGEGCEDVDENEKRIKRVIPEGDAATIRQLLSTVVTSGTAVRARLDEFAAGKTGTTENYGDAWFVGFTKRMTVAVWVGYPNAFKPMETEYRGEPVAGGTYPAEIWRDFMIAVDKIVDDRVNKERARQGLPPREDDEGEQPPPPGAPTVPGSPATPQQEAPTPSGGDPRPEEPSAPAEPDGDATPAPEPDPEPAPAPTPAPVPTPPPDGGSGGAASAAPPD
jgi:penicillin-binding protein 1A